LAFIALMAFGCGPEDVAPGPTFPEHDPVAYTAYPRGYVDLVAPRPGAPGEFLLVCGNVGRQFLLDGPHTEVEVGLGDLSVRRSRGEVASVGGPFEALTDTPRRWSVIIQELGTGSEVHSTPMTGFAPNGIRLMDDGSVRWATSDVDILIYSLDRESEESVEITRFPRPTGGSFELSADGATLLWWRDHRVHLRDISTGALDSLITAPDRWGSPVLSPDRARLAYASTAGVRVLDIGTDTDDVIAVDNLRSGPVWEGRDLWITQGFSGYQALRFVEDAGEWTVRDTMDIGPTSSTIIPDASGGGPMVIAEHRGSDILWIRAHEDRPTMLLEHRWVSGNVSAAAWDPAGTRFAFVQEPQGAPRSVMVATPGQAADAVVKLTNRPWKLVWAPEGIYLLDEVVDRGDLYFWREGTDHVEPVELPVPVGYSMIGSPGWNPEAGAIDLPLRRNVGTPSYMMFRVDPIAGTGQVVIQRPWRIYSYIAQDSWIGNRLGSSLWLAEEVRGGQRLVLIGDGGQVIDLGFVPLEPHLDASGRILLTGLAGVTTRSLVAILEGGP
jgi:hypothetical protein